MWYPGLAPGTENLGKWGEVWSFITATFLFWLLICDEHAVTQDANNCEIGVQGR